MGKTFDGIDDRMRAWIAMQHVFFVATAPLAEGGLLNLSPKGLDSFAVLGPSRVAYLDLTGSGVETIAHLRENGRIVVMFCAFEGPPRIVRLYGRGSVVEAGTPAFESLAAHFPRRAGERAVIVVDVARVADSCGYAVPRYAYQGDRDQLIQWAERKGDGGLRAYRAENNTKSLDGLPALTPDGDG
jgi:hypothetical protein